MTSEFPPLVPPAFKVGMEHAFPKGVWVTGRNGHGLWGLPDHKQHVLVIVGDPIATEHSNAGYKQQAWCLECGVYFSSRVDGEFLQERVDDSYLGAALVRLERVTKRAKKARKLIAKEMVT
jgi:hypothetical protein